MLTPYTSLRALISQFFSSEARIVTRLALLNHPIFSKHLLCAQTCARG